MAGIVVRKGPLAGQSFDLSKVTIIGRGLHADIRFDDLTASREHARLLLDEKGNCIVEDLRSGNGTFVNESRVESQRLRDGDEIRIGNSVFVFHAGERPGSVTSAEHTLLDVSKEPSDSSVLNAIDIDSPLARYELTDESTLEELAGANRRLRMLSDMFRLIGTDLDEDQLLARILDTLFSVFPESHKGFIIMRDPRTGELSARATKFATPDAENKLEISNSILQYVLEKKQAVLSKDALHDNRFRDSQSIADLQMRSVMCAPLKHTDTVLGFVFLDTLKVSSNYNEDGLALLAGIANQASLAIANARLHAQLVHQERIEQDLRNATRIQLSFLPKEPPRVEGYDFADWYSTAHEVGGDFYAFLPLPEGKLGIAIGDVSGKGMTAALTMVEMTLHIRFFAAANLPPERFLEEINKAVSTTETDVFVTLLYMVLDPRESTLRIANAGHLSPLIRRADGMVESVDCPGGFPLGVSAEGEYSQGWVQLRALDRVCLFTDGIVEAMSDKKELYGYHKFEHALKTSAPSSSAVIESVRQSLRQHMGPAEQSDDLVLLVFGPGQPGVAQRQ